MLPVKSHCDLKKAAKVTQSLPFGTIAQWQAPDEQSGAIRGQECRKISYNPMPGRYLNNLLSLGSLLAEDVRLPSD
jgi:hypothetical protein